MAKRKGSGTPPKALSRAARSAGAAEVETSPETLPTVGGAHPVRLQKFLARAGVASRRAAEELIRNGRVTVNGRRVTEMGTLVDPLRDAVRCDGRPVRFRTGTRYILLVKPRGVVSTLADPEGRPTVRDLLPPGVGRVFPVGRLDWDAAGVLILTDDGELANRLAHPRYGAERTYHVKVRGDAGESVLRRLRRGIDLEDGPVRPEKVRKLRGTGSATWISLTLREGRHHEVKRVFRALGHPVQKLLRVSFAGLGGVGLGPGQWRLLTEEEVAGLKGEGGRP